jgi:hypothetical protein
MTARMPGARLVINASAAPVSRRLLGALSTLWHTELLADLLTRGAMVAAVFVFSRVLTLTLTAPGSAAEPFCAATCSVWSTSSGAPQRQLRA